MWNTFLTCFDVYDDILTSNTTNQNMPQQATAATVKNRKKRMKHFNNLHSQMQAALDCRKTINAKDVKFYCLAIKILTFTCKYGTLECVAVFC